MRINDKMGVVQKKKCRFKQFVNDYATTDIFHFKKWDAIAYLALYIIVPVLVTFATLVTLPDEIHAAAYCYFSIAISAANCIYDACSRWESKKATLRNTKLFIIIFSSIVALIYSLLQFLIILIGQSLDYRQDLVLLLYISAIIIAGIDMLAVLGQDIALTNSL